MKYLIPVLLISLLVVSCQKEEPEQEYNLIFKYKFDQTQQRLDNFGNPSVIPAGHSAQTPVFNSMSAHYIELAQNKYTALGKGVVLYRHQETSAGGALAIDFSKSMVKANNEMFFSIPLKDLAVGSYEWLRVSLAYQNYDIQLKSGSNTGTGTVASFIGFNNFIESFKVKNQTIVVNGNKKQGFWAFETTFNNTSYVTQGQAPAGATTVPNPLASTSPIPAGSCVVTGRFVDSNGNSISLDIPEKPKKDIEIIVALSINKSFEWKDANKDGWFEPAAGDTVVDMGIRGLIPFVF
jgi:hypothetical protein